MSNNKCQAKVDHFGTECGRESVQVLEIPRGATINLCVLHAVTVQESESERFLRIKKDAIKK